LILARYLPPNACFDHPVANLDEAKDKSMAFTLAAIGLSRIFEWVMRGDLNQCSLRFHLVILSICPDLLPCKYPSASWCARIHGVSRQWASRLQQEFTREFGDHLQFRGQRFLNQTNASQKRWGRGRRGTQGPQPCPVAGA